MFQYSSGRIGRSKLPINLTLLPSVYLGRPRVLVDDVDARGQTGGGGYKYYGIDEQEGAIVVVRPDGYVGTITAFDRFSELKKYFDGFMARS